MVKLRLLQFSEIFLVSAIASRLLFWLLPKIHFTLAISIGLGVFAAGAGAWAYWYIDSGRGMFPEISLIAVAAGVLIATWF